MSQYNNNLTTRLRQMARQGNSGSQMYDSVKQELGCDTPIVTILDHFWSAFCLSLAEVKPVAVLSRNSQRIVEDEALLEELVMPMIAKRRQQWDAELSEV